MKSLTGVLLFIALQLTGPGLFAQTPVLENGVILIPQAMVFLPSGNLMYRDLELSVRNDGNLDIRNWQQTENLRLASVQSVSVDSIVRHGEQAVVIIHGFKSAECIRLEEVQVNRQGNLFEIIFAEKPVPEYVRCITGSVPFDRALFLETRDLDSGEVRLDVHGLQASFTLQD